MSRIEPRRGALSDLFAFGARKVFGRDVESARVFAHHPRQALGYMRYNRAAEHCPHVRSCSPSSVSCAPPRWSAASSASTSPPSTAAAPASPTSSC